MFRELDRDSLQVIKINKKIKAMQGNKLYVGGIPYSSTNEDLKAYFSQAGTVISAQIIIDKFSNRSKGFGFVEMGSDEEAQKAIEMFNDKDFMGRTLMVNVAKPMEERPPRTGGFSGGNRSGGFRSDRGGDRGGFSSRGGYGDRDNNRGGDRGGYRSR
ncbi:MAG: RNA-binding protein [Cyanobium sp. MAG06]|nr:RNA-binding protein [Cyanobium sp. MAG06]